MQKTKSRGKKALRWLKKDMGLNLGACLFIILPLILLQNVLAISQLVNLAVVIAIILIFFIGTWTETQKGVWIRARKGIIYAVLGVAITVLSYVLGG